MKKRVTPEALADMLMKRVYVPFSAVVSAAADGEILSLCQFDTAFAGEQMAFDERAAEVWLLSHHPEGLREMTAEDAANLNRLRRRATHARVRFFLVGEDTGCCLLYTSSPAVSPASVAAAGIAARKDVGQPRRP